MVAAIRQQLDKFFGDNNLRSDTFTNKLSSAKERVSGGLIGRIRQEMQDGRPSGVKPETDDVESVVTGLVTKLAHREIALNGTPVQEAFNSAREEVKSRLHGAVKTFNHLGTITEEEARESENKSSV